MIGDFLDTVFEYDGRLWRTLGPLMWRPGYLSREFFAGRRVRYVSPFRLFFFITVIAFFAAQLRFDVQGLAPGPTGSRVAGLAGATSVEEVEQRRDAALATLERELATAGDGAGAATLQSALGVTRGAVIAEADRRIAELQVAEAEGRIAELGVADHGAPAPAREEASSRISLRGERWDPDTNPLQLSSLSESNNERLNRWLARAEVNLQRIREDPNLLKEAFLSSVPTTLFVLVPIFALLLKLAYLFRRRLYMEHLIVALHSHAFLSASLLAVIVLGAVAGGLSEWPWAARPLVWLEVLVVLWIPVYLLLMQKRIYQQGWFLTLVKYWALGVSYTVLLSFAVVLNLLFNVVTM